MSDRIRVNTLLDYYGALLTDRQRTICDYYYREDFSMSEIAELEGISRAAVSDTIRKCKTELEHYEQVLKCIQAHDARMQIYQQMKQEQSCERYVSKLMYTELIGGEYE